MPEISDWTKNYVIRDFIDFWMITNQFLLSQKATENTAEGEYNESEQSKPLLDKAKSPNENATNSFKKKSISEAPTRRSDGLILPKVEGIELGNDAVCPFGLAKKIIVVPSRRKSKCHLYWQWNVKNDVMKSVCR